VNIDQTPSPNFNDRKMPINTLILHYTGMETGDAALQRMCDASAEVSAHYMIWEDGRINQLVDEANRAWHAGVGSWHGDTDINSCSIGIEIVNGGHDWPLENGHLPPYPPEQIASVIALSKAITKRHAIPADRIIGHSDIAPARKADPGEHFPWHQLAKQGLGLWPTPTSALTNENDDPHFQIGYGLLLGDTGTPVMQLQADLSAIGYGITATGIYDVETQHCVTAFQRHWAPDRLREPLDLETLQAIAAMANRVRT
jgi:N-acetylmuramoyl-L-alanine amidase